MSELPLVHVSTRTEWRKWLAAHHATSNGIWLVSFKKHTGKPRVEYTDAVEEALCFGWVDSLAKRIDDDRMAQKYTPRRTGSKWSPSNVARFSRLVKERRMTAAGLAHRPTAATRLAPVDNRAAGDLKSVPAGIVRGLKRSATAWKNFVGMTAAQRGLYVRWIDSAKKAETRDRRMRDAIGRLERNEKAGLQ